MSLLTLYNHQKAYSLFSYKVSNIPYNLSLFLMDLGFYNNTKKISLDSPNKTNSFTIVKVNNKPKVMIYIIN